MISGAASKKLLLQPLMGMHPEGWPAEAQREVVVGAAARLNGRSGDAGNGRPAAMAA